MGSIKLNGDTSGHVEITAPAVAGTQSVEFPTDVVLQSEYEARVAGDRVDTSETTTSASYTDLATVGPDVTLTTGTTVLVTVAFTGYSSAAFASVMSFAVSGATTLAASDANAAYCNSNGVNHTATRTVLLTGLTPGSNTFTAKYRGSTTRTFNYRSISVTRVD